mmetsp:Transcript_6319/g.18247  ORF Transcript_6319/g.18247 Transcript_6319/m.18247 type:complete len:85 (-) Transcript_6319:47-301(-)
MSTHDRLAEAFDSTRRTVLFWVRWRVEGAMVGWSAMAAVLNFGILRDGALAMTSSAVASSAGCASLEHRCSGGPPCWAASPSSG